MRSLFINSISTDLEDSFAFKFVRTADEQSLWNDFVPLIINEELVGGFIQTYEEDLANFKLLHVFNKHRSKGYGEQLVDIALDEAKKKSKYWKCTSEIDAWKFYKRIGFKTHGLTDYCDSYLILGKLTDNGLDYTIDERIEQLIKTKYTLKGDQYDIAQPLLQP